MKDKTQLEQASSIIEDLVRESSGAVYIHAITGAAQRVLDLCQPKWIYVNERFPDAEPHRNIEIACVSPYPDDDKRPYAIHISSVVAKCIGGIYAWREIEPPEPPGESE